MSSNSSEQRCHFIMSSARSGTQWLLRTLNGHPKIFATENRLFGEFCEMWAKNDGSLSPRITFDKYARVLSGHFEFDAMGMNRAKFLRVFKRGYINFLTRFSLQHSSKEVMIDKITPYHDTSSMVLENIREFFPGGKIIQLLRDGRDVATSGAFDWLLKDAHGTDRYSYFVERRPIVLNRFFDDELLRTWTKNWVEPLEALKELNDSEKIQIRYEEMIADQAAVIRRICQHIGLDCSESEATACVDGATFEKTTGRERGNAEPTSKARKGVVGDWRTYFTRQDGEVFAGLTGDWLQKLGYVTDRNWYKELPKELGIQPVND